MNRDLQQHGIIVDTVEIEPAVVEAARTYFLWQPNGFVAVEDAHDFLRKQHLANIGPRFDYIILDVFTARRRKISNLYTLESMQLLNSQLKPGGIAVINLVTFVARGPDGEYPRIIVMMFSTLKETFQHVRCFIDNDPHHTPSNEAVNFICFGSDSEIIFEIPEQNHGDHDTPNDIVQRFQSWEITFTTTSDNIFTDDTKVLIDAEDGIIHQSIEQQIGAIFT